MAMFVYVFLMMRIYSLIILYDSIGATVNNTKYPLETDDPKSIYIYIYIYIYIHYN
jgi:hypothetical protein